MTPSQIKAVNTIKDSDFLKGYKTDFVISMDWFIKPNNFIKVLEGNYSNRAVTDKNDTQKFYDDIDQWTKELSE